MGSQMTGSPSGSGAVSVVLNGLMNNTFIINNVMFLSNHYMEVAGGALYIKTANTNNQAHITNCPFQENTAYGEGAALFLVDGNTGSSARAYQTFIIIQSNFISNSGGNSVVYISTSSTFTRIDLDGKPVFHSNIGTAIYLLSSTLRFGTYGGDIIFSSNSANIGGALYCEHGTILFFFTMNPE